jgi:hypothetical protein|tara:strand:+ start:1448 stop:1636 length:189 start_codon:yes stop_codon:yes gene_type:complete
MADRYELEEFIRASSGAGYVVTHSVSEDNYETIARRAKKLESEKTPYSIYYIAKDGARDRVA